MRTIPIHALFAEDNINPNEELACDPSELMAAVEVVFAVDVMSGGRALVYGKDVLEDIVATGQSRPVQVLGVELDMETDELERLVALVRVVKGHDDYRPTD